MPSWLHETLVLLFRNQPALAAELLEESLGVEVPAFEEARLDSADLTTVLPAEYRADLVVLLADGEPVFGIVVEVQLNKDEDKRFSWPAYLPVLRSRHRCPCCVLVFTPSEAVAEWARQPIDLGPGNLMKPLVIGPSGVPVITDRERSKASPEAAVLSVMAHGKGDVSTAVEIAAGAAAAASSLPEDARVLYSDLIEAALSEAARKAFAVLPETYEFQGPTYKKGRYEAKIEAVMEVLEVRGLEVSEEQRARIAGSTDLEELRRWLRRAVVASSAAEVFAD